MSSGIEDLTLLRPPTELSDLGISAGLVEDLFARRLVIERSTTIGRVSEALCIPHAIGHTIAEQLRSKKSIEYHGAEGRDYRIALTENGERQVAERMLNSRHTALSLIHI